MANVVQHNDRASIEGVRKVSWDTGEMCEFASALVSALGSLGESLTYTAMMGTCGAAFRFTYNPGRWDFGNYGIRNISTDPLEPIRRAIEATGYTYTLCKKADPQEDTARIMKSIQKGIPVLAYPVVGPSDCCVISGYDDDGDVLLGWSTYQDIPDDHNIPHDVTGYFRKPGWHDNLHGYILLGAKQARRPMRASTLDILRWAVSLVRTPQFKDKVSGLEGLRVWAEEMTQEQYFPAGEDQTLGQRYVSAAINMTMLRDHCEAEPFLRQAAEDVPEFQPELLEAAACYGEVKRLRATMDALIGDNFTEQAMKAITDPEMRRAYAAVILQIRAQEQAAITHIEHLLERCS